MCGPEPWKQHNFTVVKHERKWLAQLSKKLCLQEKKQPQNLQNSVLIVQKKTLGSFFVTLLICYSKCFWLVAILKPKQYSHFSPLKKTTQESSFLLHCGLRCAALFWAFKYFAWGNFSLFSPLPGCALGTCFCTWKHIDFTFWNTSVLWAKFLSYLKHKPAFADMWS